ncbi:hypothetical protein C8R43DRAFT_962231 [Mycena crocata]|nr:hypothetical protein C8R43DRAFT_962231 [Mycena crocata]
MNATVRIAAPESPSDISQFLSASGTLPQPLSRAAATITQVCQTFEWIDHCSVPILTPDAVYGEAHGEIGLVVLWHSRLLILTRFRWETARSIIQPLNVTRQRVAPADNQLFGAIHDGFCSCKNLGGFSSGRKPLETNAVALAMGVFLRLLLCFTHRGAADIEYGTDHLRTSNSSSGLHSARFVVVPPPTRRVSPDSDTTRLAVVPRELLAISNDSDCPPWHEFWV